MFHLPGFSQEAVSTVINLSEKSNQLLKGADLLFLEDPSNRLTIDDIKTHHNFKTAPQSILNLGYTSSTLWVRLIINNETPEKHWNIVIQNPNLEEIRYYSSATDFAHPIISTRNNKKYINCIFPVSEGLQTVYLRIRNSEALTLPIKIADANTLIDFRHEMNVWQGIFYGIIFCFLFYNSFVFFSLRDKSFLFYVAYTFFLAIVASYETGYFGKFCPPAFQWLNNYAIAASLATIFGLQFIYSFLPIKRYAVFTGFVKNAFIALAIGAIFLQLSGFGLFAAILSHVLVFVVALYFIVYTLVVAIIEKSKSAYLLLGVWIMLPVSIAVFILTYFSVLPYHEYSIYAPQGAIVLEAVVISIALGNKVNKVIQQKELSRKREHDILLQYNKLVADHNANLQKMVLMKTVELERANKVKDKFFSIVAHDLRNPLHSLAGFLNLFQNQVSGTFSEDELSMIIAKLRVSVSNTVKLTENLLSWAKSQIEIEEVVTHPLSVSEIVRQAIAPLKDTATTKGIKLVTEAPDTIFILADENHMTFIIRNLVSNAIKFTPPGGTVNVSSALGDFNRVILRVEDDGIGMTSEMVDMLFKIDVRKNMPGTSGEKGTGLGLVLCKEFLDLNNGSMEIVSAMNRGSSFILNLPAAVDVSQEQFAKQEYCSC